MLLRRVLKFTKPLTSPTLRSMSGKSPLIDVSVDEEGIATVTMKRPPVNSFNFEYLQHIIRSLNDMTKLQVKGAVFTSAMPNIFSAGLDINEFYKADSKSIEKFWTSVQDVFITLLGSEFATAAAINGHAPAAGCLLSLGCEYRVMVDGNYKIGLNEAALGITTTPWIQAVMYQVIPKKDAERALTTAKLFSPNEALKIGLIDEIASNKEDAIERCKQYIKKFDKIPAQARALTKQRMRETPLRILREERKEDIKMFVDLAMTPAVQDNLRDYIEALKNKNKK